MYDTDTTAEADDDDNQIDEDEPSTTRGDADLITGFDDEDPVAGGAADPAAPSEPDDEPGEYSEHWFNQGTNGTCVPASIAQIVSEYSGMEFTDESAFVQLAQDNGFLADVSTGMPFDEAATLLNECGIPADVATGTLEQLDAAVERGHGVMLFVDSGEYWDADQEATDEAYGADAGPDHCVVVDDVDLESGVVYLSDPGHPDGQRMAVPIETFAEAWSESSNRMIVCEQASPNLTLPDSSPPSTTAVEDSVDSADTRPDGQLVDVDDVVRDLPDTGVTTQVRGAVDWLVTHPWILLPITLAVGAVMPARRG